MFERFTKSQMNILDIEYDLLPDLEEEKNHSIMGMMMASTHKRVVDKCACAIRTLIDENDKNKFIMRKMFHDLKMAQDALRRQKDQPSKGKCGTDEAERAFDVIRVDVAKSIMRNKNSMTTEGALAIAREQFINGYKKSRE